MSDNQRRKYRKKSIAKLQPDATVMENGFTVSRDSVQSAKNDVVEWLRVLGIE